MYLIVYFIVCILIDYVDMRSESGRKLVRPAVIDTTSVDTCKGPVTNGSQYIEGYADGCSFTLEAVGSLAECSSHCFMDFQCKAMKYTALNQCYLSFAEIFFWQDSSNIHENAYLRVCYSLFLSFIFKSSTNRR